MQKVFRGRMSPRHILPLRTVGVELEVQMIHPVFVKHTVGIVHPTIRGRMMIQRTPLFAIRGIKGFAVFEMFPARKIAYMAMCSAVSVKHNVEQRRLVVYRREI